LVVERFERVIKIDKDFWTLQDLGEDDDVVVGG
jgi:hypothetical protein